MTERQRVAEDLRRRAWRIRFVERVRDRRAIADRLGVTLSFVGYALADRRR